MTKIYKPQEVFTNNYELCEECGNSVYAHDLVLNDDGLAVCDNCYAFA